MSKMTKMEAKRRLEIIIENSVAYDNARIVMNDWQNYGKDRTYIEVRYGRKKVQPYGYIDNETGEYVPEKYGDLRKNYTLSGNAFEIKEEETVKTVKEIMQEEATEVEKVEEIEYSENGAAIFNTETFLGTKARIEYSYEKKMVDNIAYADGDNINLGKELFKEEKIIAFIGDKKHELHKRMADKNSTSKTHIMALKEGADMFFKAWDGAVVILKKDQLENFKKVMAEVQRRGTTAEAAEYERVQEDKRIAAEVEHAKKVIEKAENTVRNEDGSLMTRQEKRSYLKKYNDFYNEGGEGYLPEVIAKEDVEEANKILDRYENKEGAK